MIKTFEKDEIKMEFFISDEGFLNDIKINIKDIEFYNAIPDNKKEQDKICTQLFNTINQLLNNIKSVTLVGKEQILPINVYRDCPNPECDGKDFKLVKPCCEEKKIKAKEGFVAILECKKCKQRIWLNKDEYAKLIGGKNE